MNWLRTIGEEIFGLFVDDGNFAIAIVLWLGLAWILSIHVLDRAPWNGPALFIGLVLILLGSAIRRARQ